MSYCGWDGGGAVANGGSISGPAEVSLNFPSDIGANPKLFYCGWPHYRGDRLITDNWHEIRASKFNGVPHVGEVRFPLRRNAIGVPF